MTNADQGASEQQNVSQESGFEQVEEDAHVTLTLVLDTQNADEPVQSSSVSFNFTSKLLNLENPTPADNEIASLMETSARHATTVPENTSGFTTTIPLPPLFFNPLLQQATPTPTPTTSEATTLFPSLPDISYVFSLNDIVTNLEKDLLEIKKVDQYAQALSFIPAIVDRYVDKKLEEAINKAILAHNLNYRQEAQDEKNAYIELVDMSMRALIKEEVNTQLPQILPQAVSDFANPMIEKNVTESVEAAVLTRSSSQPTSTYEAAASVSEFELTKIMIDKMEKNKSYDKADYKKKLYDALVESYNTDKDLFDSYGEDFSLKRSQDEKDKDRDPSAGSDRGTKRRKSSKVAESSRDSRSKEKKSSSTSKDASQSQHNKRQQVNFRPPQTWISQVARAEEPPTSFDELNDTSFDFSAFVMHWLKILNLTQEILVGPAFKLLKGTCKSITKLKYHFEECSKATTERLGWHNLENKPYPFDLRNPLPLIQDHQGRQITPQDYFINKDLEYLKGGDLSRRYSTFVTKTKAATYNLKWIKDLVPNLWSPVMVKYDKHAYWVTRLSIMKKCDYGHLEEIEVRREDQKLYKFREGDFPRLRLQDIEDMLLLLVQKKLTNLTIDERFRKLPKEAQPYQARHIHVKSRNRTTYTAYSDPKGVIYKDQMNRNRLLRADELHKFNDGTLDDVRSALNDIAKGIRMEYLPMRKWSNLDKKRARVMVQDIDKQLYQRRLMRNLEKFIGGREYGNDLRLLERTI
ncbi:hypothetical protein Tco_0811153 [Tanacetum coccineum]